MLIVDVQNSLMRELRGVEGLTVVQKSPWWVERCRARRGRWLRTLRVHDITLDPGSAIFTWAVEFSGQVVSGGTQGQGGFVDRSDEIVIGTTERVVEARTVHRMPAGQQGDARCAKSTSGAMATESSRGS